MYRTSVLRRDCRIGPASANWAQAGQGGTSASLRRRLRSWVPGQKLHVWSTFEAGILWGRVLRSVLW